jgi:flagellin
MNSSIDVVKEIKKKLVTATEDGVDKTKINEEIKQLQGQLKSIAEAASFSGENWLESDIGGKTSVVASFVRDSGGNVSVKKVDYDLTANNVLFDKTANTGILDQVTSTGKNGVVVNVNVNGTVGSTNVIKYTTAEVSANVTGASGGFDAGGNIAWTVASDGAGAGRGYVKVGDDTWVEAVEQSQAVNDGQETFAKDAGNNLWAIDLAKTSTAPSASVAEFSISNLTQGPELDGLIQNVDAALAKMTSAAASLGSISSRISLQDEFVSQLSSAIDKGVGRLVDADMNEESTRLKALQTQQQLAIQSLSIANNASQNVLSLFR